MSDEAKKDEASGEEVEKENRPSPEQLSDETLAFYREKWLEIGLCKDRVDPLKGFDAVRGLYEQSDPPKVFPAAHCLFVQSPLAATLADWYIKKEHETNGRDLTEVMDEIRGRDLFAEFKANPEKWPTVEQVGKLFQDLQWCYGYHDVEWLSYCDVFIEEGIIEREKVDKRIFKLMDVVKTCGWFLPYAEMVILCDRNCALHRNTDGQLHKDGEAALSFTDGFGIYMLNGVGMPKDLVLKSANELDPHEVLKAATNAEIRRELIRKIGMERVLDALEHKVLDEEGDYQLLDVQFGIADNPEAHGIYLKMKNPSIDTWHLEGVGSECKTVQDALNDRASEILPEGADWKPSELT